MFNQLETKIGSRWQIGWSVVLHALILIALIHSSRLIRVRTYLPGTSKGTHIDLTYLPSSAPPSAEKSKPDRNKAHTEAKKSKLTSPTKLPPQPPVPSPANPSSSVQTANSTNDALGTDDIQIALTTYSPSPKPDLSRVPHGTQGEVVLDVTIDPTGQVADLQILATLGYGVDGAVVDTVRTWKFSPATKDGVPVASVQELHFHYGPV